MDDDPSAASYIHMVHRLIEECIVFNMNKEQCMEALSKHANIKPLITSTVWNELEKENREFFENYNRTHPGETRRSPPAPAPVPDPDSDDTTSSSGSQ